LNPKYGTYFCFYKLTIDFTILGTESDLLTEQHQLENEAEEKESRENVASEKRLHVPSMKRTREIETCSSVATKSLKVKLDHS